MSINMLFSDPQNGVLKSTTANWNSIVVNGGGSGGGSVSSVSNNDNNLNITPSTGAVVVDLEPNISIENSLIIGSENTVGQFNFDTNGNLNLPGNSNNTASTYIKAGVDDKSNNAIDMFVNWNPQTGVYGGECYLSNDQAYIGLNGVSNAATSFVSLDNTTTPGASTLSIQVKEENSLNAGNILMNPALINFTIPSCSVQFDTTTTLNQGTITFNCSNSTTETTKTMSFTNDSSVGGLLSVDDITSKNYNINGEYDLPNTAGAAGTVMTCQGAGLQAIWQSPASVSASYINLSDCGTFPLGTGLDVVWLNKNNTLNITSGDLTNIQLPLNSIFYVNATFCGLNIISGGSGCSFNINTTNCSFYGNSQYSNINGLVAAQTGSIQGILITNGTVNPSIKFTYTSPTVVSNGGCSCTIFQI